MGFFDRPNQVTDPRTNYGRGFNLTRVDRGREFIGWYPTRDAANSAMKQMMFSDNGRGIPASYHIEAA